MMDDMDRAVDDEEQVDEDGAKPTTGDATRPRTRRVQRIIMVTCDVNNRWNVCSVHLEDCVGGSLTQTGETDVIHLLSWYTFINATAIMFQRNAGGYLKCHLVESGMQGIAIFLFVLPPHFAKKLCTMA